MIILTVCYLQLNERLKREGVKSHKERVEELNQYLSNLSEHHDMCVSNPGCEMLRNGINVLTHCRIGRKSDLDNGTNRMLSSSFFGLLRAFGCFHDPTYLLMFKRRCLSPGMDLSR